MENRSRIGFGSCKLPVQEGMELAGYGTKRICQGIHDPLFVQCVVLESESNLSALFVFDLLAVDELIVTPLEEEIKKREPKTRAVLCSAIHTHSAPGGILQTECGLLQNAAFFAGKPNLAWIAECIEAACDAFEMARKNLAVFDAFQSEGESDAFASNRTRAKADYTSRFYSIEFDTDDESDIVVLIAVHPTILHETNLLASADLVWGMREKLKEAGYRNVVILNGPCGDLSTRFTRKGSDFDEARRMGEIGAEAVLRGIETRKPILPDSDRAFRVKVILEKGEVSDSPEQIRQKLEAARDEALRLQEEGAATQTIRAVQNEIEACQAALSKIETLRQIDSVEVNCTIWKWSDQYFVTVPGELFSSLVFGKQFENIHFICYTNGYILYLPDRIAYEEKLYEAMASPLAAGQPERFIEILGTVLEQISWTNEEPDRVLN